MRRTCSTIAASILGKPWSTAGENVGVASSSGAVFSALMGSSAHYANIMGGAYTTIGVGAAVGADGQVWVVQVFAG